MKLGLKLKTALPLAIALATTLGAQASTITGATASGFTTKYDLDGSATAASLTDVLDGSSTAPGANIELGRLGLVNGVLSGTVGTHSITMQGLTFTDWFNTPVGGTTLAEQYIQSAATAYGITIANMAATVNQFKTQDIQPGTGVVNPWQLISDPNISYVLDDINGELHIGLAGYFNATTLLAGLFGPIVPANAQASEVVKVSLDGGPAQYLYSFEANQVRSDGTAFFSGNYDVRVIPEPSSVALLGLGLVGMVALRRRKATQA
jgi:hypothetical protein